jgi:hypothetical protein
MYFITVVGQLIVRLDVACNPHVQGEGFSVYLWFPLAEDLDLVAWLLELV